MDTFSTLAALAAFVAIGIGVLAILAVVAPRGPLAPVAVLLDRRGQALAMAVATASTAGSLWYSEVEEFVPCTYCWYQRIAMYPLVVVLGVGLLRRDRGAAFTALPLAVIGFGIAVYHYQLQLFPEQSSSCDLFAPCTQQWVDTFGFVSIPFMAGSGFFAIASLMLLSIVSDRRRKLEATGVEAAGETQARDDERAVVPPGPSTR